MEKVFLVDAYALIFRFYYAFIGRPMRNAAGVNTSAVFGFVKFLKDLILRERPHYLGVAFDPPGGNFRHELYADYKANRSETPEDIVASVPYIKQVLEAMRIPVLEIPGYEADDVIGTLSQKAAAAGYEVFMVTPDKDYGQLIRPAVRIYKQRKGGADGIEIIGCEQIREHYGIDDPCRVIDVLALWGDASDNIPGVQGIGEKSAIKLVCQFGTVENLLAHTELLSGKQRVNIEAARDQIMLAKRLATIRLDVPVEFEPEKLRLEAPDTERLAEAYRELGFRSFLAELRPGAAETAEKSEPASPQQSKSKTAVPARGPVLGTGDSGRAGGGIAFRCAGLSDDRHRAACLSYGHGREGSARAGRQAGGFVRILLRHGDDRIRRVRRPTRGPVVRRGAVRGVVRPVRSGEPRTGVVDPAPRVRERADRQDRPERQVRSDDAPQRRNRRARYALRYDDRPLSARSRIASRHGSSGAHLSRTIRPCRSRS